MELFRNLVSQRKMTKFLIGGKMREKQIKYYYGKRR